MKRYQPLTIYRRQNLRSGMIRNAFRQFALICVLAIQPALTIAHEAWIEPSKFQLKKGEVIKADIRVGQRFRGNPLVYNTDITKRLTITNGKSEQNIKGRLGDLPAIKYKSRATGLHILTYESTGKRLTYETEEKFEKFARKEGVEWVLEEHRQRNNPKQNFTESFFRHAKALVAVGHSKGEDRRLGLLIELIAITNPYENNPDAVEVELLWQGTPYSDAQITIFRRPPGAETIRETVRTNDQGRAMIPTYPGQRFLLSAIHMLPQVKKKNAPLWHSHWASLTYKIE